MTIGPSLRLAMLLSLSHVMAALVVYATFLSLAVKLAMLISILWSLFFYLTREVLRIFPDSWRKISFDQGSVSVVTHGGPGFSGTISSRTIISPYFIVLRVRLEGRRLPAARTIFPDSLGINEFRELCVRLKFSQ